MATQTWNQNITISDPPIAQALFSNTRWAWFWLIIRVYMGYTWLTSGWGKLSNPAWVQSGEALKGFWERAVAIPEAPARPMIAFDWYRQFLQALLDSSSYTWFAKLVVAGEILIGLALVSGLIHRHCSFLWRLYELELYDGWNRQCQPGFIFISSPIGFGLENCRVVGSGSLAAAPAGFTLAAGKVVCRDRGQKI